MLYFLEQVCKKIRELFLAPKNIPCDLSWRKSPSTVSNPRRSSRPRQDPRARSGLLSLSGSHLAAGRILQPIVRRSGIVVVLPSTAGSQRIISLRPDAALEK